MIRSAIAVFLSTILLLLAKPCFGQERAPNGFYYPLGRSSWSTGGGWMERDPAHGGGYFNGEYHIGEDMMTAIGSVVYAISDGKVIWVSSNGWGTDNVALAVRHTLLDGTSFVAVYGHVKASKGLNDTVEAGKEIAKVGAWSNGDHLHFGVHPGAGIPSGSWGRLPNSAWDSTNGFVDPVAWLRDKSPFGWSSTSKSEVRWISLPQADRWYRSEEKLVYHVDGSRPNTVEEWAGATKIGGPYDTSDGYVFIPNGPQGWHTYKVTASNAAGGTAVTWVGGYDNEAPNASQSGGAPANQWLKGSQSVSWHSTDNLAGVRRFWYKWEGSDWQGPYAGGDGTTDVPEGVHKLWVRPEDHTFAGTSEDGNRADREIGVFKLDNVVPSAPAISLNPPSPQAIGSVVITASSSDLESGVARIELSVVSPGGSTTSLASINAPSGTTSWDTAGIKADGVYTIKARALDVAGNWSPESSTTYQIDRTGPSIQPFSFNPPPPSYGTIGITVTANDQFNPTKTITVYAAGVQIGVITGSTGTVNYTAPDEGELVQIKAVAEDAIGNTSERVEPLTLDRTPPTVSHTLTSEKPTTFGWYTTAPTLTVNATAHSGIKSIYVKIGFQPEQLYTAPMVLSKQGSYSVTYYAVSVSNVKSEPATFTIKVDITKPPVPALVDDGASTPSQTSLNITIMNPDEHSGIRRVHYRVGTLEEPAKFFDSGPVDNYDPFILIRGLRLPKGANVVVSARQMNGAGVWSSTDKVWGKTDGILIDPDSWPVHLGESVFTSAGGNSGNVDFNLTGTLGDLVTELSKETSTPYYMWSGWIATLMGQIFRNEVPLEDWLVSPLGVPVKVELRKNGEVVQTLNSFIVQDGEGYCVKLEAVLADTYDVRVKGLHWLSRSVNAVNFRQLLTRVAFEPLVNGDVDGDNEVTLVDRDMVNALLNVPKGDPRYDVRADIDGNGIINWIDREIVKKNLKKKGT